jgi:hypothetical protein
MSSRFENTKNPVKTTPAPVFGTSCPAGKMRRPFNYRLPEMLALIIIGYRAPPRATAAFD